MFSKPIRLRPSVEPNVKCIRAVYIVVHSSYPFNKADILKKFHVYSSDIAFSKFYHKQLNELKVFYPDATEYVNKFYTRNRGKFNRYRFILKRRYKTNLIIL